MFQALYDLLHDGDQLHLTLSRLGENRLQLLLQPKLKAPISDSDEDDIRASKLSLAMPLSFAGSPDELTQGFIPALIQYGTYRDESQRSLNSALDKAKEMNKQAKYTSADKSAEMISAPDSENVEDAEKGAPASNQSVLNATNSQSLFD